MLTRKANLSGNPVAAAAAVVKKDRIELAATLPWEPAKQAAKAKPGAKLELRVRYHEGKKHLPVVETQRVA